VSIEVSPEEYARLSALLSSACGIQLGDKKEYLVASRLTGVLVKHGMRSISELLLAIEGGKAALKRQLVDAMTTHETLWFRDQYPFEALKRMILPELARARVSNLRIWSAACSSGQEPYSISMIADEYNREYPRHPLGGLQIVATDISSSILGSAREGAYEDIALARGLTSDRRSRYFDEQGTRVRVKDLVRKPILFQELNLIAPFAMLGRFHIVFCRNVLIYFSDDKKRDILDRIAQVLEPGGYLFMGGSESAVRYSAKFEVARCYGGMVFKLK